MLRLELLHRAIKDAKGCTICGADGDINEAQIDALNFLYNPQDRERRSLWLKNLPLSVSELVRRSKIQVGIKSTQEAMRQVRSLRAKIIRPPRKTAPRWGIAAAKLSETIEPLGCEFPAKGIKGGVPDFVRREAVELYTKLRKYHRKIDAAGIAAYIYGVSDTTIERWAQSMKSHGEQKIGPESKK